MSFAQHVANGGCGTMHPGNEGWYCELRQGHYSWETSKHQVTIFDRVTKTSDRRTWN